jgi:hypothetical protein
VIGDAVKVMRIATGEEEEVLPERSAAAELGSKGGKARALACRRSGARRSLRRPHPHDGNRAELNGSSRGNPLPYNRREQILTRRGNFREPISDGTLA